VFRNPLASPDIIGVSSGASAGAAAGILFLSGTTAVTTSAFAGALAAVVLALGLSALDRSGKNSTIVLAGIAVHSLAQTALMCLKLTADPERELASIEYWIMGGLSSVSLYDIGGNPVLCVLCIAVLFLLHRQIILLSAEEGEARMLGVSVGILRLIVLLTATLMVSAVVSITGLISFVGLLAPHGARMLNKNNRIGTMFLSGAVGGILLCGADLLARSVAASELPVSIFTSLLGAPFLIFLILRGRRTV
jgi:iron complex transport system permease protein